MTHQHHYENFPRGILKKYPTSFPQELSRSQQWQDSAQDFYGAKQQPTHLPDIPTEAYVKNVNQTAVVCFVLMYIWEYSTLFLFVVLTTTAAAHKLLIFSFTSSKSHMLSNGRIADALAQAGHNVTLLSLEFLISTDELPTTKYARVIRMGSVDQGLLSIGASKKAETLETVFKPRSLWGNYNAYKAYMSAISSTYDSKNIGERKGTNRIPSGRKFRRHFRGAPVSVWNCFGTSSWNPDSFLDFSDHMTFWQRAENSFQHWITSRLYKDLVDKTTQAFRKHWDSNFIDVMEYMRSSTPLIFVAVSELMDFPRPIMHNVIYIGGLGMKNARHTSTADLSEPFATEMTKGVKGVVFVSFGSNVNTAYLPDTIRRNLIDGLAAISDSYHVILKLEKEDTEGISYARSKPNIFVTSWAPQAQLLQHPRLKIFFTHGGYNSLLEVAQSGKPVLLMPFMYDQTRNAMMVQRNGWGHMFDRTSLMNGWTQLEKDLRMVLEDPKFEKGAKRIQNLLATKPFSADEIFLRNVQFVLENNGTLPELQATAFQLSFIRQFNLDIILIGILTLMLLFCVIVSVILICWKSCRLRNVKKKAE
ncbi:UDP-glucoronosyl and UDP-glucosyl transferase domain-containing protein [Ditylenchus destructor]|uniref:glucuronosyltransferase n=1 Tax=Ditylenchus destructor TaxID=166010 RepID=A0AAD4QU61_9BILA|nr:UDP-glucoronosyl and UDP-glucosyl transferase domain-containing protein [Ditylenchus destructor]